MVWNYGDQTIVNVATIIIQFSFNYFRSKFEFNHFTLAKRQTIFLVKARRLRQERINFSKLQLPLRTDPSEWYGRHRGNFYAVTGLVDVIKVIDILDWPFKCLNFFPVFFFFFFVCFLFVLGLIPHLFFCTSCPMYLPLSVYGLRVYIKLYKYI